MTEIKTSELTGPALDWAVAKCEGWTTYALPVSIAQIWMQRGVDARGACVLHSLYELAYSTNWSQGGPIIERMCIWLSHNIATGIHGAALDADGNYLRTGPTPLIAAMRCFVASKLGDEVDVPTELCYG